MLKIESFESLPKKQQSDLNNEINIMEVMKRKNVISGKKKAIRKGVNSNTL
jgi:hypothetical protein